MKKKEIPLATSIDEICQTIRNFVNGAPKYPKLTQKLWTGTKNWVYDPSSRFFGPARMCAIPQIDLNRYHEIRIAAGTKYPQQKHLEALTGSLFKPSGELSKQLIQWSEKLMSTPILAKVDSSKWKFITLPQPASENLPVGASSPSPNAQRISQVNGLETAVAEFPLSKPPHGSQFKLEEIEVKPPDLKQTESKTGRTEIMRSPSSASAHAKANAELGLQGEKFVFEMLKAQMEAKRPDLAERMMHTSQDEGDGCGYDILVFNLAGEAEYIEVKTTTGKIDTPFFITENELAASDLHGKYYVLVRLFNFDAKKPKLYRLRGPLRPQLELKATTYRARPQNNA